MATGLQSRTVSNVSRRSLSSMSTAGMPSTLSLTKIDGRLSLPAIVIEIGNCLIKCGYAGDHLPRSVSRTEFYDERLILRSDFYSSENWNNAKIWKGLFQHIFYDQLLTMPTERRVVIVENVLTATETRETICKVLLDDLQVPSVLFVPSHLCATFPFNTNNALVVDVGFKETIALPVAEGVTMLSQWEVSSCAGARVQARVGELLRSFGEVQEVEGTRRPFTDEDWADIQKKRILEDIASRLVFCTSLSRGGQIQSAKGPIDSPAAEVKLPIGDKTLILSGYLREAACEVLFDRGQTDELTIPQLIHNVIARCPIDLRKKMFESIMVVGGTSLIPGFLARVQQELIDIGRENGLKTCETVKFYGFDQPHMALLGTWVGASMLASSNDALNVRSLTKELWAVQGLPDWTDFSTITKKPTKPEATR